MTQVIPIPDEYKDKLDRYLFLLSRACANIEFFIMNNKEEASAINDPLFKRLFSEAERVVMDYHKTVSFTADNLLDESVYKVIKVMPDGMYTHKYLIASA